MKHSGQLVFYNLKVLEMRPINLLTVTITAER